MIQHHAIAEFSLMLLFNLNSLRYFKSFTSDYVYLGITFCKVGAAGSSSFPPACIHRQRPSHCLKAHWHHRPAGDVGGPVCACFCGQWEPLNPKHIFTDSTLQARTGWGAGFSFVLWQQASGKNPTSVSILWLSLFVFNFLHLFPWFVLYWRQCLAFSKISWPFLLLRHVASPFCCYLSK